MRLSIVSSRQAAKPSLSVALGFAVQKDEVGQMSSLPFDDVDEVVAQRHTETICSSSHSVDIVLFLAAPGQPLCPGSPLSSNACVSRDMQVLRRVAISNMARPAPDQDSWERETDTFFLGNGRSARLTVAKNC